MPFLREKALKKQIIDVGKKLYDLRLVTGRSGNLSLRLRKDNILITKTGSCIGSLKSGDIISIGLNEKDSFKKKLASSEYPLHRLIYQNFLHQAVIHCHPPLSNAYFTLHSSLEALTFEARHSLGKVLALPQKTITVTKPLAVIKALKKNNLVFLKNHGVVSAGSNFQEALFLIETLESSVKTLALAQLFKKKSRNILQRRLKSDLLAKIK
jgi:L-fuculose-phosphate aldolase